MAGKLNLDIPGAIAEFESLINKILPRKIFYKLLLRGKGLEFDGYRYFAPDDDADCIDWKASARSNNLLVKQYIEERDMKIMLVVDVSENMVFGSQKKLKCEFSAELAAALAHVTIHSGDQIGFVLFNNKIEKIELPKTGKTQFDIFVSEISDSRVYRNSSNLKFTLDELMNYLNKSISLVIIISDFIKVDEGYKKILREFGSLFETVALIIRDPLDKTLPDIDKEVVIESPDTGEKLIINPGIVKRVYEKHAEKQLNLTKNIFRESGIEFLELSTKESFSFELASFLKRRSERRGY